MIVLKVRVLLPDSYLAQGLTQTVTQLVEMIPCFLGARKFNAISRDCAIGSYWSRTFSSPGVLYDNTSARASPSCCSWMFRVSAESARCPCRNWSIPHPFLSKFPCMKTSFPHCCYCYTSSSVSTSVPNNCFSKFATWRRTAVQLEHDISVSDALLYIFPHFFSGD